MLFGRPFAITFWKYYFLHNSDIWMLKYWKGKKNGTHQTRQTYAFKPFMSLDVLRSTYFSYAHSIISYGIIFWGNSSYSEDILKIPKRIIRIIMNSSRNASCRQLFKDLNILQSQYIYIQYFYLLLKIKNNI